MKRKYKVDPFNYDKWTVASTAIQVVTAVGGIVLAVLGEPAGLLGLGALFGGKKGTLLGEVGRQFLREGGVPVKDPNDEEEGL